jgi:hypothetical protein
MKLIHKQAQSFVEYAVLISLLAAALFGMKAYLTGATQARYRQAAEVFGQGEQYAPGQTQTAAASNALTIPGSSNSARLAAAQAPAWGGRALAGGGKMAKFDAEKWAKDKDLSSDAAAWSETILDQINSGSLDLKEAISIFPSKALPAADKVNQFNVGVGLGEASRAVGAMGNYYDWDVLKKAAINSGVQSYLKNWIDKDAEVSGGGWAADIASGFIGSGFVPPDLGE